MTRKQGWLCATALLLVLGTAVWGTLVMAASGSQDGISPAATITVTTTGDTVGCGTPCSLRGAIMAADSGDTIVIPAGIYTLTLDAELTIEKSLALEGAGSGESIIQAAIEPAVADFRVFNIAGGNVTISGVTIRHGEISGNGGGINNTGTLSLSSSTVSNNTVS